MNQYRNLFIKITSIAVLFIVAILLVPQTTLAETKDENIASIISETQKKIYTAYEMQNLDSLGKAMRGERATSRLGHVDFHKIEKILNDGAEKVKKILSNPNYDLTQEPDKTGISVIHHVARIGYYTIMSSLLEDDKYLALMNSKDAKGNTVLDNANFRFRLVMPFLNPTLFINSFRFVPYVRQQDFYEGDLQPHEKTISILRAHGAKSTCLLADCYRKLLKNIISQLDEALEKKDDGMLRKSRRLAKQNLNFLYKHSHLPDSELARKINIRYMETLKAGAQKNAR